MTNDKRLIEDYLPIEAISKEASKEKSVRMGHISTLHLWWARRPLVACRAAVYGALVPASRFVPNGGSDEKKKSLGRANSARFVKDLCQYPGGTRSIEEAQRHILIAHADRLTQEIVAWKTGKLAKPGWIEEFNFSSEKVTVEDITEYRAPRPRVLDMFAGGGAIPLEASRLGCEASALDLNPVAHIIQMCTLVYPQKYGKPDTTSLGMTGPKNAQGQTTWGGLSDEVRFWGKWVLKEVRSEIGSLYPPIPDPHYRNRKVPLQTEWFNEDEPDQVPAGYMLPVDYLWTRTVKCKNPACGASVPLLRQTWLCKKEKTGRFIAMKAVAPRNKKAIRFEVVEAATEKGLGFDPAAHSSAGNATCRFCNTVADSDYVKAEGCAKRFGYQPLCVVCLSSTARGRHYIDIDPDSMFATLPSSLDVELYSRNAKVTIPDEVLEANPRSFDVQHFGFSHWRDVFLPRQLAAMVTFSGKVRAAHSQLVHSGMEEMRTKAVTTCLSMVVGRLANQCTSLCRWQPEFVVGMLGDAGLPMILDFAEINPLADSSGGWPSALSYVVSAIESFVSCGLPASVVRGSAVATGFGDGCFDAIITDPPYYDSRSYSNLSDHFYVWHKRILKDLYPLDFTGALTPKKTEAIAASYRHAGVKEAANEAYEGMMEGSFREAHRLLKPGAPLVCVYAHKTTAGWSTLINALRNSGFCVVEAWPVEMERKVRPNAQETAALASSIFLVASKREPSTNAGNYDKDVVPELQRIVRERVDTLWDMGISGADLVIACVGAGLRAFTRYGRVELDNGEEAPAERFLAEVETVVLEAILGRLSKTVGSKNGQTTLAGLDPATRFYVLWRYTYRAPELDAGEAIIFANGTHVELDGQHGLSQGKRALLKKKAGKYRLHDYTERGDESALGQPAQDDTPAPGVDTLHRLLWLMEHKPLKIPEFLSETKPNVEQLRLVAQALAGPALSGGELSDVSPTAEQSALAKLLANWSTVMVGKAAVEERRTGQQTLFKN
jgi:putative DNA methylase